MWNKPVNIGFGNIVPSARIIAMVSNDSAPVKRLIQEARDTNKLVDATQGRRTRTVIMTDSGHVILSAILPETIASRMSDVPPVAYQTAEPPVTPPEPAEDNI